MYSAVLACSCGSSSVGRTRDRDLAVVRSGRKGSSDRIGVRVRKCVWFRLGGEASAITTIVGAIDFGLSGKVSTGRSSGDYRWQFKRIVEVRLSDGPVFDYVCRLEVVRQAIAWRRQA